MKTLRTLIGLLLLMAGRTFAADSPGEWQQSLDGLWQFTTNQAAVDDTGIAWDHITVPGNWDTLPEYSTYKGMGWYRREFTLSADWQGKRIRLKFDAVYHDATVWLNGKELGRHHGGYTPFEFDVTGLVKYGEPNTLLVSADNSYGRGAWWHWGGISRSVTLIANHDTRIVWQHIRSEPDLAAGTAKVFVQYRLANAGSAAVHVALASALEGTPETSLQKNITIPALGEIMVDLELALPKDRVRLWHFDHPNLYQLTTTLTTNGQIQHEQTDRFGIRKIEVTKDSLLLNGERIRVNGFNRVSDNRKFGNTEPDELVKLDVDLMKRANGNLTRLMHHPQAPNLLDYLDEKGMLIWGEIPVWGGDKNADVNVKSGNLVTRQWMSEMIARDYNHPCIIGWSVGNEITEHYDYVKDMIDYTRTLDPHRMVAYASYTGARKNYTPENDPISVSDIILYNAYPYNRNSAEIVHSKWPDKPIFFSEFGVTQFGTGPAARIDGLAERMALATVGRPYVIGISLWTFNDYRSDYPNTPPSGNREWGIVEEDRRPKAAYQQVRELFSPVRSLSVKDGFIYLVPRGTDETPSFILRGYKLRWDEGEIALPNIKPGDPVWTSESKIKPGVVVRLISPTGYDVAESRADH